MPPVSKSNSQLTFKMLLEAGLSDKSLQETQKKLTALAHKNDFDLGFDPKLLDKHIKQIKAAQVGLAQAGVKMGSNLFTQMDTQFVEQLKRFETLAQQSASLAKGRGKMQARADAATAAGQTVDPRVVKALAKYQEKMDAASRQTALLRSEMDKTRHEFASKGKIVAELLKKQKAASTKSAQLTQGKAVGQGILGVFGHAKSGDLKGFTQAIVGGGAQLLEHQSQKTKDAAKLAEASGMPGAAGQMAMAEGLGNAAVALAGVAAAVGAFIALLSAADNQAKEFNKSLLEGAGAGDFAFKNATASGGNMLDTLDAARNASINMVDEFRGEAKEYTQILSQLDQAGMTYKEMTAGAKDASEKTVMLADNIRSVVTWSKVLGLATSEVAQKEAELQNDYGIGQDAIKDRFLAISEAAQYSGMSTKNFYTSVSQATSGMSLYNVRMEEAADLLSTTSKILGGTDASDYIKNLAKGYKDLGATDRTKEYLLQGPEKMAQNMASSLDTALGGFATDYGKNPAIRKAFADALGKSVDDVNLSTAEGVKTAFGEMTAEQQTALIAAITSSSDSQVSASYKQIAATLRLEKAVKTNDMNDVVAAMGDINMASVQSDKWGFAAINGIHMFLKDMEIQNAQAYQNIAKTDAKGFQESMNLQEAYRAQYETKFGKAGTVDEVTAWAQKEMAKSHGTGETAKKLTEAEQWAQTTATNTQSITDILKNDVVWTLEKIYAIMESVFGFVEPEGERTKEMNLNKNTEEIAKLNTDIDKMVANNAPAEAIAAKKQELDQAKANTEKIVASTDSWTSLLGLAANNVAASASFGMLGDQKQGELWGMMGRLSGITDALTNIDMDNGNHTVYAGQGTTTTGEEIGQNLTPNQKAELKKYMAGEANNWNTVGRKAVAAALDDHDVSTKLAAAGVTAAEPAPVNDFISRPGQKAQRFSSNDTLVGYKPGGPIDKATGSGTGGPTQVVININGGDQKAVYDTVTKAMQASKTR